MEFYKDWYIILDARARVASVLKRERGLPFELKIPNETTINVIKEAQNDEADIVS